MKNTLSVVISAYNEEQMIEDCLKSISFADEVIVVDNTSLDKTAEIAKKYKAKIFQRPNNLMLNVNKNYGFSKALGDWILSLDADERVTPDLQQEIKECIVKDNSEIVGYWIKRKNVIFNKWIENSIWWPDYQLRLFRKGCGKFAEKHVHEYIEVSGKTEKMEEAMIHQNYSSISQFISKMDKIYSENEVQNYIDSGKAIEWHDALRFPVQDFIKTYFAQKGYKDGLHGLVLSILQAFYSEVVFAKIWEKKGFQEKEISLREIASELKRSKNEIDYWIHSAFIEKEKNPIKKIFHRIGRKNAKRGTR